MHAQGLASVARPPELEREGLEKSIRSRQIHPYYAAQECRLKGTVRNPFSQPSFLRSSIVHMNWAEVPRQPSESIDNPFGNFEFPECATPQC